MRSRCSGLVEAWIPLLQENRVSKTCMLCASFRGVGRFVDWLKECWQWNGFVSTPPRLVAQKFYFKARHATRQPLIALRVTRLMLRNDIARRGAVCSSQARINSQLQSSS